VTLKLAISRSRLPVPYGANLFSYWFATKQYHVVLLVLICEISSLGLDCNDWQLHGVMECFSWWSEMHRNLHIAHADSPLV